MNAGHHLVGYQLCCSITTIPPDIKLEMVKFRLETQQLRLLYFSYVALFFIAVKARFDIPLLVAMSET